VHGPSTTGVVGGPWESSVAATGREVLSAYQGGHTPAHQYRCTEYEFPGTSRGRAQPSARPWSLPLSFPVKRSVRVRGSVQSILTLEQECYGHGGIEPRTSGKPCQACQTIGRGGPMSRGHRENVYAQGPSLTLFAVKVSSCFCMSG
jgi:hypothetical protein